MIGKIIVIMPLIDLSPMVPPSARWVKIHYEIIPKTPGARLIARLWSGAGPENAVVIEGSTGDVFVKLNTPQKLSYQNPVNVTLKMKVTAYKDAAPET